MFKNHRNVLFSCTLFAVSVVSQIRKKICFTQFCKKHYHQSDCFNNNHATSFSYIEVLNCINLYLYFTKNQGRLQGFQRTGAQLKKSHGSAYFFPKNAGCCKRNEHNFENFKGNWGCWHLKFLSRRVPGTRCQSSAGAQVPMAPAS